MTGWRKRTIMEMAREAGLCTWIIPPEYFVERVEAFAKLVRADERNRTWTQQHWTDYERSIAAAEREACAKLCEELYKPYGTGPADAIRARGEQA